MLGECLKSVREQVPLVHNITNYVTVNDVANVLLACGGSPIMSDEPQDVEDITTICGGLNINIGTLNERSIEGMFAAGRRAKELGHPILLDPVGAGASKLRTETALKLMEELQYGKGYQYAHNTDEKLTNMECLPESMRGTRYYYPTGEGEEKLVKEHLEAVLTWKMEHEAEDE